MNRLFLSLIPFIAFIVMSNPAATKTVDPKQAVEKKTETFKVYGNCDMCKETIEGALQKKDGVLKKKWDSQTKMLTVTYDSSKITITQIKQKIADVGYDTDEIRAKDETYSKLKKCCRYERPKK